MISNQDVTSIFVLVLIIVFYLFQVFQKTKLLYLFRSVSYHFTNIFFLYNPEDLNIHGRINYFNYFYIFFYHLINGLIMVYLTAFIYDGSLKVEGMDNELFKSLLSINLLIYGLIFVRFLIIKIALLMLINFTFYNLNSFYTVYYLKNTFLILVGLHFIFQAKNYYSSIIKFELKEVMYFILYLCAFKLAPWLWLYSILL